jgi:hypothetical protein
VSLLPNRASGERRFFGRIEKLNIALELTNTIWRAIGEKRIPARLAARLLGAVNRNLTEGFLVRSALDAVAHYRNATKLSTEYASRYLTRTLDPRGGDVAVRCKRVLASFDERQRRLAAPVGLKLLPETFR